MLGLAAGSKSLFVSSSSAASLSEDLTRGCAFDVGLRVERSVSVPGSAAGTTAAPGVPFEQATNRLAARTGQINGLGPGVVTLFTGPADAFVPGQERLGQGGIQVISRTGALAQSVVVASSGKKGIWLADTTAKEIGASAGQTVTLRFNEGASEVEVPVAGIIKDLSKERRPPYWCSMERSFESFGFYDPPPTALVDQSLLLDLTRRAGETSVAAWWEYPPVARGWDLSRASAALRSVRGVIAETNNKSLPLGRLLGAGPTMADAVGTIEHAQRAQAVVDASIGPVALGTAGVALLMLVVAARTWADRHRQELALLALHGAGPGMLALKGALELLSPLLVGAALGLVAAPLLVQLVGPGSLTEAGAYRSAALLVGAALVVALVSVAVAVFPQVRRVGSEFASGTARRRSLLWEPLLLVAAGAALYELNTRGSSVVGGQGTGTRVDSLLLLFPLLLLAGGAGLLARGVLAAPVLRRGKRRLPWAGWLALRRMAAARARAAPIITATAVAIGMVVFASSLSSTLRSSVHAKAILGPGSQQAFRLETPRPIPAAAPFAPIATAVIRTTEDTGLVLGHDSADVLGVDPDTFARAAYWDSSFSDRSLGSLLGMLQPNEPGGEAVGLAVGAGLPDRFTLLLPGRTVHTPLAVRVAARPSAFPGYAFNSNRPLVVVNRTALARLGVDSAELWVNSESPTVAASVRAAGLNYLSLVRASDRTQGGLEPQLWSLRYLELTGLAAGIVAVCGIGIYFAADAPRRRLARALSLRLGVTSRTALLATGIEVGALLVSGLVIGVALAWLALRLLSGHLDPLPVAPPDTVLRFSLAGVGLCALAAVALTVAATGVVEQRAARASLPTLLRDDV